MKRNGRIFICSVKHFFAGMLAMIFDNHDDYFMHILISVPDKSAFEDFLEICLTTFMQPSVGCKL